MVTDLLIGRPILAATTWTMTTKPIRVAVADPNQRPNATMVSTTTVMALSTGARIRSAGTRMTITKAAESPI